MKCAVCKAPQTEVTLYEGIAIGEMIRICESCAEEKGVPIIKRPSVQQLEVADEHHSVRERMERLSGMRKVTPISSHSSSSQTLRSRLREPPRAQFDDRVVQNYHWNLTLARRRRKLTVGQVASATGVSQAMLVSIERGKIPKDFEDAFVTLEDYFGIRLLSKRPSKINFLRKDPNYEKEILESVREKMDGKDADDTDESSNDSHEDVTLNKLIERKRARDKQKRELRAREKEDAMIGDDLDLDLSEV